MPHRIAASIRLATAHLPGTSDALHTSSPPDRPLPGCAPNVPASCSSSRTGKPGGRAGAKEQRLRSGERAGAGDALAGRCCGPRSSAAQRAGSRSVALPRAAAANAIHLMAQLHCSPQLLQPTCGCPMRAAAVRLHSQAQRDDLASHRKHAAGVGGRTGAAARGVLQASTWRLRWLQEPHACSMPGKASRNRRQASADKAGRPPAAPRRRMSGSQRACSRDPASTAPHTPPATLL